jgi:hypothetical protein
MPLASDTASQRAARALLAPPTLIALALLIANDWWWKAAWPGWLTGKLSDFAGIAFVALLMFAAWPTRRVATGLSLAVSFAFWKSTASQPVIEAINTWSPFPIGRVPDATDLLALAVLPWCAARADRVAAHRWRRDSLRRVLVAPATVVALLAVMGTSSRPLMQQYSIRSTQPAAAWTPAEVAQEIRRVAEAQGLRCVRCDKPEAEALFASEYVDLEYRFNGTASVRFVARGTAKPEGVFFGVPREQRLAALRDELKAALGQRFKNLALEYVEPLTDER